MTERKKLSHKEVIIAQLRRDGNYDVLNPPLKLVSDHSTTKTGWKL